MTTIIYSGLVSVAVAMLTFILQNLIKENHRLKMEKDEAEQTRSKALENGVLCLLRMKLIEYHSKYMEDGAISLHGYQNWILMYEAYTGLGGNGMMKHMRNDIEDLRLKSGR
jgi:hypothetical protein